jgi:hypothetical protein
VADWLVLWVNDLIEVISTGNDSTNLTGLEDLSGLTFAAGIVRMGCCIQMAE